MAFLPVTVGIAISAGVSNTRLMPRFGPRPLVPTGMFLAAAGMLWLAQLSTHSSYAANILGPMFGIGLGVGLAFAPSINTATAGIDAADAGVGSAMVNTSQQIGGAIGTAVLSTVFSTALSNYLSSHRSTTGRAAVAAAAVVHGDAVAFGVSAGIFLAGVVLAGLLLRSGPLDDAEGAMGGSATVGSGVL